MNPLLLLGWQRYAVYGALVAAVLGLAWLHGCTRGELKLADYKAEQARAAVPIIVKQGEVTERVVIKWRKQVVKVKGDTETIVKEIVKYVPPAADPVLPAGFVMLHDAAAVGAVPAPAAGVDVAAPAIAASKAIQGVVENYGTCKANAVQLLALQEWIRWQYETANGESLGY